MYLLRGADEKLGVACLGGECFGQAGQGFLRFSVAQPPEKLTKAVDFIAAATTHQDRVEIFLEENPRYRT